MGGVLIQHARRLVADITVTVRQFRAEVKRVPGLGTIAATVHDQFNFAVQHIADFLAGMTDIAIAAAANRDMMDVPLQQIAA